MSNKRASHGPEPMLLRVILTWLCTLTFCSPAQSLDLSQTLANLDIVDLANIEITSVSRHEARLLTSPAAVAVITADDARRLGATSIPEALRAVPGLQVARMNANTWAISARGFNDQYANKLLVLVDGRSVYTPTFSGVYWDVQDLVLEDLERIEIIRGPGSALWGANAVNGVINIITKSARETQGGLVAPVFGTEDQPGVSARYGGQLSSNVFYRVYTKYFNRTGFEDASGRDMSDDWDLARGGLRLDWEASESDLITLQGDYHSGTRGEEVQKTAVFPATDVLLGVSTPTHGGNILARWRRQLSEDSEFTVQTYYDGYIRDHAFGGGSLIAGPTFMEDTILRERRHTWDIDAQHRFRLTPRQQLVWGAGFRYSADELDSNGAEIQFNPEKRDDRLFSLFAQDEISVVPDRLILVLGSKFEHNDFTGCEVQPGGRIAWTPTESQCLWASVARAVRTPSRLEQDVRVNLMSFSLPDATPAQVSTFGNPDLDSEELVAYEIGYRIEPSSRWAFDVAAFYNSYDIAGAVTNASVFEPTPAPPHLLLSPYVYANGLSADTWGIEFRTQCNLTESWRVTAGYSWLRTLSSDDPRTVTNPEHQFHVQSSVGVGRGVELHGALYYMDQIQSISFAPDPVTIPSHLRLDLGITWAVSSRLELAVWGQNLIDDRHAEFASYKTSSVTEIPRTFFGRITWRF